MAPAIDTVDGWGLSSEARHELLLSKSKLYITNKTEHFSFKNGCTVRVAKLIKEDWPIVLQ